MKTARRLSKTFLVACICLWSSLLFVPLQESTASEPGQESDVQQDSIRVLRDKYKSRQIWETLVALPGDIVYIPVELLFNGTEKTIEIVEESKLVPKVKSLLISDDGRIGVLPVYKSRLGLGAQYFHKGINNRESKLTLKCLVGIRQRQFYEIRMKRFSLLGGAVFSDAHIRYQFLSDEDFFGVGSGTETADESNYAHEQSSAAIAVGRMLNSRTSLNTIIGFSHNIIHAGKDTDVPSITRKYSAATLPGLGEQIQLLHVRLMLQRDSRNSAVRPASGNVLSVWGGVYTDIGNSDYGFWKFGGNWKQYIDISYDRTFILRIAGEFTEPIPDQKIPFYYLSELGHQESIRGFERGRFRDHDMVLSTLEYRYPIGRMTDMVLFVDVGMVSDARFSKVTVHDANVGYGGGFRVWGREGLFANLELGFSREGFRYYFNLNKSL